MDGVRARSRGFVVSATLVAVALAVSLSFYGTTSASAVTSGSAAAHDGATDRADQTARKADAAIHRQMRPAMTRWALHIGNAAPAASVRVTRDDHISSVQPPAEVAAGWDLWTTDAPLGRAPPA